MIRTVVLSIIFLILLVSEVAFFPYPLIVLFSCILYLLATPERNLYLIFIFGLLLDIARGDLLGKTPLFIFAVFLLTVFYNRNLETARIVFLLLYSFMSASLYGFITGYSFHAILTIVLFVAILVGLRFVVYRKTS